MKLGWKLAGSNEKNKKKNKNNKDRTICVVFFISFFNGVLSTLKQSTNQRFKMIKVFKLSIEVEFAETLSLIVGMLSVAAMIGLMWLMDCGVFYRWNQVFQIVDLTWIGMGEVRPCFQHLARIATRACFYSSCFCGIVTLTLNLVGRILDWYLSYRYKI